MPKYDIPPKDPAHIFTNEEINLILDRFKNNHCVYYAFLTAYCTGLRIAEVFALIWDDIDFHNKTISVNKNILKKNQTEGTKGRHLSGNSTTVWYFGTCKTETSYRTIHELGIPCRFHDFRDTHATRLIEAGSDIKAVSKRLGHRNIDTTYNIYVRVTEKMESETADKFEKIYSYL